MQTDAILSANNTTLLGPTCCVCLHGTNWKLLGPCKRAQHCWPTTRDSVGPNMLRRLHGTTTMLAFVGTLCIVWNRSRSNFRPMQTDATLLANNTRQCWAQHVTSVCMEPQQCWHLLALVPHSLKPVKFLGPYKRAQHCWPKTPNNTQQCCDLLRPFAWAFNTKNTMFL